MEKTDILSLNLKQLQQELTNLGQQKFRAKQIYSWLHIKNVNDFEQMTDISKSLIAILKEHFCINSVKAVKKLQSRQDNTIKYLYELNDGNHVETVLMEYNHANSICVSTQVGCKMGCRFCASTIAGFKRNLTAGEILSQIYMAEKESGKKVGSIVLMGIGEPLDNFDNVVKFLELISDQNGHNISQRHISVSTCGVVPNIKKLEQLKLGITLSISLHATTNKNRSEIMPVNNKYNIEELISACKDYFETTKRRISFEYSLIDGVNDSIEDIMRLKKLLGGMVHHINIIPINSIKERNFKSTREHACKFCETAKKHGLNATVRRTLGADIDAACGQLRREYEI